MSNATKFRLPNVARVLDEFANHPAPFTATVWRAWVLGNYDGDTITVRLDRGFYETDTRDVRILGINAPELRTGPTVTREQGVKAKAYLAALLPPGTPVELQTFLLTDPADPVEKYGRFLAAVTAYEPDGTTFDVATKMLASGLVKPYPATSTEPK